MMHDQTIAMLHERQGEILRYLILHYPDESLLQDLQDVHTAIRVCSNGPAPAHRPGYDASEDFSHIKNASTAAVLLLRRVGAPMEMARIIQELIAAGWGSHRDNPGRYIRTSITTHMEGYQHKKSYDPLFAEFNGKIGLIEWKQRPSTSQAE